MAEREEDDREASEGENEGKKSGSSNALMIKIAIGLTIVVIGMAAALFYFKFVVKHADETATSDTQIEQDADSLPQQTSSAANATLPEQLLPEIFSLQQQVSALQAELQNFKTNEELQALRAENEQLKKQIAELTGGSMQDDATGTTDKALNKQDLLNYQQRSYPSSANVEIAPKWGNGNGE